MAGNRKFNRSRNSSPKLVSCSCGGDAKLSSRKNYPFGRKSKGVTFRFYRCKSCKRITNLSVNESGGKK